ncbi:5' nucleotidase, NT5C type [Desulfoluna butyratoxydans]|uniref:5'(3')-deoxyribonucleotidase n=1 Tax=Desulfoluna butyratoxydans TaxID=231438 RepID=A0A4U8YSN1_9BACT|nr:bifunctional metallophosphatase/5'-nucleotidase [Desulfoluna butyratoxydans]VFQ44303.1 5'(3')-deoxyribonucleotidase [Desulfoluna butyratoxydans]
MKAPIFVDMDDVIAETTRTYPALVRREFGVEATYEGIADFDLSNSFGLSRNQLAHLFKVVHTPEVLMGFSPVAGARETLAAWQTQGYPIAVVTGRPPETREISLAWLKREKVPFDSFDICDKYGRHHPRQGPFITLDEVKQRPYTLAVEDSLSMAAFLSGPMEIPTFLFDRPWNRRGRVLTACTRCTSWPEIAAGASRLLAP